MTWNAKYWDILDNLFWAPRYLGLKSIPRKKWIVEEKMVSIPRDLIATTDGPLYFRSRKVDDQMSYLERQEETLNHLFDLTFSIAGDDVISQALCGPLALEDSGPFDSIGREIRQRYRWGRLENVTQQDGFFVSQRSLVGVELKLGSKSSAEQIAKYLALMVWEELESGPRDQHGLLFVVSANAIASQWKDVGLKSASLDDGFVNRVRGMKVPSRIRNLFAENSDRLNAIAGRLKLGVISWEELRNILVDYRSRLDHSRPGDQTLDKLLDGLCNQINRHGKTGIAKRRELILSSTGSDRELHEAILSAGATTEVLAVGPKVASKVAISKKRVLSCSPPRDDE
jgi:hypothetical protein